MAQKNQMIVLAALVLIMGVVWYFNRTTSVTNPGNVATFQNYQLLAVENPQLHRDKMEEAQKTEYHSLGRNPFSEIAPPKDQPKENKIAQHLRGTPAMWQLSRITSYSRSRTLNCIATRWKLLRKPNITAWAAIPSAKSRRQRNMPSPSNWPDTSSKRFQFYLRRHPQCCPAT